MLSTPEGALIRVHTAELEGRIARIRQQLHEVRIARNGGKETAEPAALSEDERFILRELSRREFAVDREWGSVGPRGGDIEFAVSGTDAATEAAARRDRFLSPADDGFPVIDAPEAPGERAPEEIERVMRYGVREWAKDAGNWSGNRKCILERSPDAERKAWLKDIVEQMAISGAVTTVGTGARALTSRISTGVSSFNLSAFSIDLPMSLFSQAVSMGMKRETDSMLLRWVKVLGWSVGRNEIDLAIYQAVPWHDTHGLPLGEATRQRGEFNFTWNLYTSPVSPLMFRILSGVECLAERRLGGAPGAAKALKKLQAGHIAFKTGNSVLNSVLYYQIRGGSLGY